MWLPGCVGVCSHNCLKSLRVPRIGSEDYFRFALAAQLRRDWIGVPRFLL
jgi:hypothetical protein